MTDHCSPGSEDAERVAFKEAHKHLDLDEITDAWGRTMFMHSHVDAMWHGWKKCAAMRTPAQEAQVTGISKSLYDSCLEELTWGHAALDRLGSPREENDMELPLDERIAYVVEACARIAESQAKAKGPHGWTYLEAWEDAAKKIATAIRAGEPARHGQATHWQPLPSPLSRPERGRT